ncbi:MAG: hypothetical protein IPJ88_11250 [Myxococcales bacterium]|nr:MAG: hypothetical protein IPJ88_11250 [Myxococcales bacterium]
MSNKRWRLVVTSLGGSRVLQETEVAADNWITALRLGKEEIGEDGGLPSGANCDVQKDGKVTILDTKGQRSYVLTPDQPPSSPPPSASQYPQGLSGANLSARPSNAAASASNPPLKKSRPVKKTMAYGQAIDINAIAAAQAAQQSEAPHKNSGESGWTLLTQRDIDPTDDAPLLYKERAYTVNPGTALDVAERLLRGAFEMLRAGIAMKARGKYISMAVFDHAWSEAPLSAPLITLEWKDWRGIHTSPLQAKALNQPRKRKERLPRLLLRLRHKHKAKRRYLPRQLLKAIRPHLPPHLMHKARRPHLLLRLRHRLKAKRRYLPRQLLKARRPHLPPLLMHKARRPHLLLRLRHRLKAKRRYLPRQLLKARRPHLPPLLMHKARRPHLLLRLRHRLKAKRRYPPRQPHKTRISYRLHQYRRVAPLVHCDITAPSRVNMKSVWRSCLKKFKTCTYLARLPKDCILRLSF